MAVQLSPSYREVRIWEPFCHEKIVRNSSQVPTTMLGIDIWRRNWRAQNPGDYSVCFSPRHVWTPLDSSTAGGDRLQRWIKHPLAQEKKSSVSIYILWTGFPPEVISELSNLFCVCFTLSQMTKKKKKHSQKNPTTLKKKNRPVSFKKKLKGTFSHIKYD